MRAVVLPNCPRVSQNNHRETALCGSMCLQMDGDGALS